MKTRKVLEISSLPVNHPENERIEGKNDAGAVDQKRCKKD